DVPLVWTVDFDQDRVFYDRYGQHLLYRFSMPEKYALRLRFFESYTPLQLPVLESQQMATLKSLAAAPCEVVPEALVDLVHRLASDYEHNWRESGLHVQRYGLHPLAMGVLSCFTLNFRVQKICSNNLHLNPYRTRPDLNGLLKWRTWPSPQVVSTLSLGSTQIIITERMNLALSLVYEHFSDTILGGLTNQHNDHYEGEVQAMLPEMDCCQSYVKIHYIVTSIREIQYFELTWNFGQRHLKCTPKISFFDGSGPPSKQGVQWLLNAIHQETYPVTTPIHDLPLELQEMILDYACPARTYNIFDRTIFAAKLGIGVSFSFRSQTFPIRLCSLSDDREIDRHEPEYQLLFWDEYVGLTYQVDKGFQLENLTWKYRNDAKIHVRRKANSK
ncbi:hypothetical protein EK21DRAFT_57514, partial [Setomelanomma holmii]